MRTTSESLAPRRGAISGVDWPGVIKKHGLAVMNRLRAEGLSFDEANEYSQAAWVRLFERYQNAPATRLRFPGLVIVVARNLFIDAHRRQSRWRADLSHDLATALDDPGRVLECRTLLRNVDRQLARIGGRDKAIFLSVVVEERSIHEVAAEHGIGRSQAYSIVARVRAELTRFTTGPD